MNIRATVVCLPVRDLEKTLAFYQKALGFADVQIEEGMIALELPDLSLFLMEKDAFEMYSGRAGIGARLPSAGQVADGGAGMLISCAMGAREEVDAILAKAAAHGGTTPGDAGVDESSGSYMGYFFDPDGYLWELVWPGEG